MNQTDYLNIMVSIEQVELNLRSLNSIFSIYFNSDLDKDDINGLMYMGWAVFADTQNSIAQVHKKLLEVGGDNLL